MPLFDWLNQRSAGVLLHPTALPGSTGIGTLGEWAYKWVDLLAQLGMRYWQVLPLGPTGYGDSPYQAFSAFAGSPYLVDLTPLVRGGLLKEEELSALNQLGDTKVDFGAQYVLRFAALRKAYDRYKKFASVWAEYGPYERFLMEQQSWLKPYALFMALKDYHKGAAWENWEVALRRYDSAQKTSIAKSLSDEVGAYMFYQYLFFGQWTRLKGYAASRGVHIIGDIPIFVAADSAEVWANPELFELGADSRPTHVAGVPPDYFSATGQRWGNPLYDWDLHARTGYRWWLKRLSACFALYDVVRIDHFRGFYDYWKIPAGAPDARTGEWVRGPGIKLFEAVAGRYPEAKLIAEDLGELHDGVRNFLAATGLPGMSILQFAFGGDAGNPYMPHNARPNQVVYTGTHDNDTTRGWFESAPDHVRNHFLTYLNAQNGTALEAALRVTMESTARLAIVPAQDIMGLPSSARFNTPGTASGNWQWRMTEELFRSINPNHIRGILAMYGRM